MSFSILEVTRLNTYSIKDIAHLTGIKAHTIRIWEQRYNIVSPKRTDTNIRYYNLQDLKLILNVSLLKNKGYKISKIASLNADGICKEVSKALYCRDNYQTQINALTLAMIDIDRAKFERIMHNSISKFGMLDTMQNIIYPFLERIGILWLVGNINPAQEHFMTNLIRQKLIAATDALYRNRSIKKQKTSFLLFLPEEELHEIGLLFASYIMQLKGFSVTYLGQSVPLRDVFSVHKLHPTNYIFSIITAYPEAANLQAYLDALSTSLPNTKILLSGVQVNMSSFNKAANITILESLNEMITLLKSLQK